PPPGRIREVHPGGEPTAGRHAVQPGGDRSHRPEVRDRDCLRCGLGRRRTGRSDSKSPGFSAGEDTMRMMSATITALLAGACFGVGPQGARAQPPQAPQSGAPAAEAKGSSDRPEDVKAIGALNEAFTRAYN